MNPRDCPPAGRVTHQDGWRGALLRALAWSTLVKFAALLALWWLFFASYAPPTPESVSRHLQLAAPAAAPAIDAGPRLTQGSKLEGS